MKRNAGVMYTVRDSLYSSMCSSFMNVYADKSETIKNFKVHLDTDHYNNLMKIIFEMIPEKFQSNSEFILYKGDYIMSSLGNTTGITYKPLKIKSKQCICNYRNKCKRRAIKKRERLRGMSRCDKLKIKIRIIQIIKLECQDISEMTGRKLYKIMC